MVMNRGRIPDDDLHESLSEGEGACSGICDGRSHLPLRGKLGWMTHAPVKKRPGNGMRLWGSRSQASAPFLFWFQRQSGKLVLPMVWIHFLHPSKSPRP